MATAPRYSADRNLRGIGVFLAMVVSPCLTQAQITPLGPAVVLDQGQAPRTAIDSRGRFMVVWDRDNTAFGYAQIFDEQGRSVVEKFPAAAPKRGGVVGVVDAAVDDSGSFFLMWHYSMKVTDQSGIAARLYGPLGEPLTKTHFVAPEEIGVFKWSGRVARSHGGATVVLWEERGHGGGRFTSSTLSGQRFDLLGRPVGEAFTVRKAPGDYVIGFPQVAMEDRGCFTVVWAEEIFSDREIRYFLQRFRRNGEKRGARTLLRRTERPTEFAMDPSGELVAVWLDEDLALRGRWLDPSGRPRGATVDVAENDHDVGFAVAKDSFGNTVVLWTTRNPRTPTAPVFGRIFDRLGLPVGEAVDLGPGRYPQSVEVNRDGIMVVVWAEPEDRRHTRVLVRRFELSCAPGYESRCEE